VSEVRGGATVATTCPVRVEYSSTLAVVSAWPVTVLVTITLDPSGVITDGGRRDGRRDRGGRHGPAGEVVMLGGHVLNTPERGLATSLTR
jgi:hypothetical protein